MSLNTWKNGLCSRNERCEKTVISIKLFWYYLNSNIWNCYWNIYWKPFGKIITWKKKGTEVVQIFWRECNLPFLDQMEHLVTNSSRDFWGKRGYLTDNPYPQLVNQMQRMCQVVFHMFSAMSGWQLDVIGCEWKYWRAHVHELSLSSYRINKKRVFVGLHFT